MNINYKKIGVFLGIFAIMIVVIVFFMSEKTSNDVSDTKNFIITERKIFEIAVTSTGELQAENYIEILAPSMLQSRNLRVNNVTITDIVPEGTVVSVGDYVATLDKTDLDNTLKGELESLITAETNLEVRMLDTAVTLSNARDNIKNQIFAVEEATIKLQQSKYEPPATIRQAEIALDKVERSLEQIKKNYELQIQQSRANIRVMENNLIRQKIRVNELGNVLSQFEITSPGNGMIIYKKERDGSKRKIGSSINTFDLVIATLPDMSSMISRTYVNEIDVSNVRIGQDVRLTVDAFAGRTYTGKVIDVSNIGEQLPNTDAKVFEVFISIDQSDAILRPAMTTGNRIIIKTIDNVIYVPLSAVTKENEKSYVYIADKKSRKKIEVKTSEYNESHIIIEEGLNEGTQVCLN